MRQADRYWEYWGINMAQYMTSKWEVRGLLWNELGHKMFWHGHFPVIDAYFWE